MNLEKDKCGCSSHGKDDLPGWEWKTTAVLVVLGVVSFFVGVTIALLTI